MGHSPKAPNIEVTHACNIVTAVATYIVQFLPSGRQRSGFGRHAYLLILILLHGGEFKVPDHKHQRVSLLHMS